jgi:hypothetical protein
MTRWSPDTCGCVLDYDDKIQHVASVQACPKHAHLAGQDHLDGVLAHNRAKNAVLNHLVAGGHDATMLAVGYDPEAPADADPVIVRSAGAKVDQAALVAKFGAGKVKVA